MPAKVSTYPRRADAALPGPLDVNLPVANFSTKIPEVSANAVMVLDSQGQQEGNLTEVPK